MPAYQKPPLTYEQQLEQLGARGLAIGGKKQALELLSTIGYYRLSGYWSPLLIRGNRERFRQGASLEEVYLRYQFDASLRQVALYAINHVEIELRAAISYHVSHTCRTGLWLTILDLFTDPYEQAKTLRKIGESLQRSREPFALHYKEKYKGETPAPPCWIGLQFAAFGDLVTIFNNLKDNAPRDKIAKRYRLHRDILASWLKALWELRNRSAHHSPIWNRNPKNQPTWPKILARKQEERWVSSWEIPNAVSEVNFETDSRKSDGPNKSFTLYALLCCAKHMVDCINPNNTFRERTLVLLPRYQRQLWVEAGFTEDWEREELWLF